MALLIRTCHRIENAIPDSIVDGFRKQMEKDATFKEKDPNMKVSDTAPCCSRLEGYGGRNDLEMIVDARGAGC